MKEPGKSPAQEALFPTKALVIGAFFFFIYSVILFSLDPEWVAWAGPVALGALYVPNQPPPLFAHPETAFKMGFLFSVLSLLALVGAAVIRNEAPFKWWNWLKARLRAQLEAGTGASSQDVDARNDAAMYNGRHPARGGDPDAALPHCRGVVPGDLRGRGSQDRQFL